MLKPMVFLSKQRKLRPRKEMENIIYILKAYLLYDFQPQNIALFLLWSFHDVILRSESKGFFP